MNNIGGTAWFTDVLGLAGELDASGAGHTSSRVASTDSFSITCCFTGSGISSFLAATGSTQGARTSYIVWRTEYVRQYYSATGFDEGSGQYWLEGQD